ncbi:hypothetical protein [Calothrix rhizosoleniae]|uniref:hypothetical protein n=1 Tax=Calothrix rhizosoleniae TaxID=888997 RepID=UPI001178BE20|nr:hypothetical protein [Calothrix rhizosoleniae]
MSKHNHFLVYWGAVFGCIATFIGFIVLAGFVPPSSPNNSIADVISLYQNNLFGIRAGMVVMLLGVSFTLPFVSLISSHMHRIEGANPILAPTQLIAGTVALLALFIPPIIWSIAAFRLDRDPQITMMLHDAGWIFLVFPAAPAIVQNLSIGLAILSDRGSPPIFPRWVGFLNFWAAFLFIPSGLITYFKTGAFAWNGILAFWVPFGAFSIWLMILFLFMYKSIIAMPDDPPIRDFQIKK